MDYFVLRSEKTGKVLKVGRFGENLLQESFHKGEWVWDEMLDREMFDGLLEEITQAEAEKIIAQQVENEKIAA